MILLSKYIFFIINPIGFYILNLYNKLVWLFWYFVNDINRFVNVSKVSKYFLWPLYIVNSGQQSMYKQIQGITTCISAETAETSVLETVAEGCVFQKDEGMRDLKDLRGIAVLMVSCFRRMS